MKKVIVLVLSFSLVTHALHALEGQRVERPKPGNYRESIQEFKQKHRGRVFPGGVERKVKTEHTQEKKFVLTISADAQEKLGALASRYGYNYPVEDRHALVLANENIETFDDFREKTKHLTDAECAKISYINLGRNFLTHIPSYAFKRFPNVQGIIVSSNALRTIAPQAFADLKQLKAVMLDDNSIKYIPASAFEGCSQLKFVALGVNPIKSSVAKNLEKDLKSSYDIEAAIWRVGIDRYVIAGLIKFIGIAAVIVFIIMLSVSLGAALASTFALGALFATGSATLFLIIVAIFFFVSILTASIGITVTVKSLRRLAHDQERRQRVYKESLYEDFVNYLKDQGLVHEDRLVLK